MADSSPASGGDPRCVECGKPLEGSDKDRSTCHDCRSPEGKLTDLDIAIRASGGNPDRIQQWPEIRHFLRKRFGEDRSDTELWERFTDWLRVERRLARYQYLPMPLDQVRDMLADDTAFGAVMETDPYSDRKRRAAINGALARYITILKWEETQARCPPGRGVYLPSALPDTVAMSKALAEFAEAVLGFDDAAAAYYVNVARQGGTPPAENPYSAARQARLLQPLVAMPHPHLEVAALQAKIEREYPAKRVQFEDDLATALSAVSRQDAAPGGAKRNKTKRRRKRNDPKSVARRAEREKQRAIDEAIHAEWRKGSWDDYQDYANWKNEHLPAGWPRLDRRYVELGVGRQAKRLTRMGKSSTKKPRK